QARPVGAALGGSETILLVEDEAAVREVAARGLRERGYTVIEAASGEEALDLAQGHKGTIHLLLTDAVLPRIDGPEVYARLRARRPQVKVLYVSGYPDAAIIEQGLLRPGVRFLQKPFTPETLAWRVREVLDAPAEVRGEKGFPLGA
ncbi:MAG: response regulator, partial [Gemmatimonadetes bacterium]|nr:response regulator [Gemmatimonadota bacterium]